MQSAEQKKNDCNLLGIYGLSSPSDCYSLMTGKFPRGLKSLDNYDASKPRECGINRQVVILTESTTNMGIGSTSSSKSIGDIAAASNPQLGKSQIGKEELPPQNCPLLQHVPDLGSEYSLPAD